MEISPPENLGRRMVGRFAIGRRAKKPGKPSRNPDDLMDLGVFVPSKVPEDAGEPYD